MFKVLGSRYLRVGLFVALCGIGLGDGASLRAADLLNGQWTLNPAEGAGQVHLMLVRSGRPGNTFTSGSDWNTADLKGLDLQTAGKHDVRFTIERDAGRFDADGFVSHAEGGGAEGAGLFRFTPAPGYAAAMAAAGFPGVEAEKQLGLALSDVSVAFAKEMKALGLEDLDLRNLRAFRIHHVDLAYIKALRAQGVTAANAKSLIAFRIHEVTPEFAKAVRALGYVPSDKQLVALRIHNVTPEYISGLKAHGMENLTLDKVINLKIHGIS
ncbi:MAG: hypothetical protein ACYCZX_08735 [Rhodospirillaceae bacterium]